MESSDPGSSTRGAWALSRVLYRTFVRSFQVNTADPRMWP